MARTTLGRVMFATGLLALGAALTGDALAQTRRRAHRGPRSASAAADAGVAQAPPPATPELVSIPVGDISRMMNQMRVWLFNPPMNATGYGLSRMGTGQRLWALLPSCRQPNPDDPRDPCPVDRMIVEAVGAPQGVSVNAMDPQGLAPGAESRRVQSFVISANVSRVRVKLMGLQNRLRYEAVVDVPRLAELPLPAGSASGEGFQFDLTQYPAR